MDGVLKFNQVHPMHRLGCHIERYSLDTKCSWNLNMFLWILYIHIKFINVWKMTKLIVHLIWNCNKPNFYFISFALILAKIKEGNPKDYSCFENIIKSYEQMFYTKNKIIDVRIYSKIIAQKISPDKLYLI